MGLCFVCPLSGIKVSVCPLSGLIVGVAVLCCVSGVCVLCGFPSLSVCVVGTDVQVHGVVQLSVLLLCSLVFFLLPVISGYWLYSIVYCVAGMLCLTKLILPGLALLPTPSNLCLILVAICMVPSL